MHALSAQKPFIGNDVLYKHTISVVIAQISKRVQELFVSPVDIRQTITGGAAQYGRSYTYTYTYTYALSGVRREADKKPARPAVLTMAMKSQHKNESNKNNLFHRSMTAFMNVKDESSFGYRWMIFVCRWYITTEGTERYY